MSEQCDLKESPDFSNRVICNSRNFRNVALTMAVRHQKMMAYSLDTSSFFKLSAEMDNVTTESVTSFPENVQHVFS